MARSKNQSITLDGKTYTRTVTGITSEYVWASMDKRETGWVKIDGYRYLVERTYQYDDQSYTLWTLVEYRDGTRHAIPCRKRAPSVKISADARAWLADVFVGHALQVIESCEYATATMVYHELFNGFDAYHAERLAGREIPADLKALDLWCNYVPGIEKAAMVSRIKRVLDTQAKSDAGTIGRCYAIQNGKEVLAYCAPATY
jgi:hypothetical protein|tara:strand:- start:4091 stop:4696 length:606 start_codon:yes stop_codon:yes gene_type:complete